VPGTPMHVPPASSRPERLTPPLFGLPIIAGRFAVCASRLSTLDTDGAHRQGEASTGKYSVRFPVMQQLDGRPSDLFGNTSEAHDSRQRYGMVAIRGKDVAGALAKDPRELVAWASVLRPPAGSADQPVLMLDIMSTAILDNVEDPHDIDEDGKNLFSELVRMVIVAYAEAVTDLLFSRWDRAARSHHWSTLERTLSKRAHVLRTWIDGDLLRWDSQAALITNSVGAATGRGGGLTLKSSSFGGLCHALNGHRWPHNDSSAPLGVTREEGVGKRASRPVVWHPARAGAVGWVLQRVGEGDDLATIAAGAAALDLPLARKGSPFAERKRNGQIGVIRRLLQDREALTLYRDGVYAQRVVSGLEGQRSVEGWELQFAAERGVELHEGKDLYSYGFRDFELIWGRPGHIELDDHQKPQVRSTLPPCQDPDGICATDEEARVGAGLLGFGWSPAFWDVIRERSDRVIDGQVERPRRAFGPVRLFAGRTWQDDMWHWRIDGSQASTLAVERSPLAGGPWEHVVTCTDLGLARAYGVMLQELLLTVEACETPLDVERRTSQANVELSRLRERQEELEKEVERHVLVSEGLVNSLVEVATWGLSAEQAALQRAKLGLRAASADEEADRVRGRLEQLLERMHNQEAQLTDHSADVTEAATLSAVILAGVVAEQQYYDPIVAESIDGITRALTLQPHPKDLRQAVLRVEFNVPLTDGDVAIGRASRELKNLRRWGTDDPEHLATETRGLSLARRRFADSVPLNQLLNTEPGEGRILTPDRTLKLLRGYLERHGIRARGARSAAVDCPVVETTTALWAVISGDTAAADHLNAPFAALITRTYTGMVLHPHAWVGREVRAARRLLAALLSAADPRKGVCLEDLRRVTGLSRTEIGALARAGIVVRSERNRDVMHLVACPHCGGSASHYLPVPETLVGGQPGLVCPDCLRMPEADNSIVLPDAYRQFWENVPDPMVHRLADGPGTTLSSKAAYQPTSGLRYATRPFNVAEAADHLGISMTAVRAWADEGFLASRRITGVSKRTFEQADLDVPVVQERAREWTRLYGTIPDVRGLLPLHAVAKQLGVAEHSVRKLVNQGELSVAHDAGAGSAGGKFFDPVDVAAIPATWAAVHQIGLLSVKDVTEMSGMLAWAVRAAADSGRLPAVVHGRSWRRYERHAVSAWVRQGCPIR
jgi:hypothetical protein